MQGAHSVSPLAKRKSVLSRNGFRFGRSNSSAPPRVTQPSLPIHMTILESEHERLVCDSEPVQS